MNLKIVQILALVAKAQQLYLFFSAYNILSLHHCWIATGSWTL